MDTAGLSGEINDGVEIIADAIKAFNDDVCIAIKNLNNGLVKVEETLYGIGVSIQEVRKRI